MSVTRCVVITAETMELVMNWTLRCLSVTLLLYWALSHTWAWGLSNLWLHEMLASLLVSCLKKSGKKMERVITRMWWEMVAVSELKEKKLETFLLLTGQMVSSKDKLVSEDQKEV